MTQPLDKKMSKKRQELLDYFSEHNNLVEFIKDCDVFFLNELKKEVTHVKMTRSKRRLPSDPNIPQIIHYAAFQIDEGWICRVRSHKSKQYRRYVTKLLCGKSTAERVGKIVEGATQSSNFVWTYVSLETLSNYEHKLVVTDWCYAG